MRKQKTLIIDNYDSFTFNLYQILGELKGNPVVFRNDEITLEKIEKLNPTHVVISPGPGRPDDKDYFGINLEVILKLSQKIPTLGVCLGHQGICYAFGGKVVKAPKVMHGKTSTIVHNRKDLFQGIQSPIEAMRYHSLIAERKTVPRDLEITAYEKSSKMVMGVRHKKFPLFGIQFHPESVGTSAGKRILQNFLAIKTSA